MGFAWAAGIGSRTRNTGIYRTQAVDILENVFAPIVRKPGKQTVTERIETNEKAE